MFKMALDGELLTLRKQVYIDVDFNKTPHMLIVGGTGSGKTYFSKQVVAKILKYEDCDMIVCDYKGDQDFSFLDGKEKFYRFDDCKNGVDEFETAFRKRQSGEDQSRKPNYLFFDEWASFIASFSTKKEGDEYKNKIANLMRLGRSFGFFVILTMQRADASFFSEGSRDNFGVIVGLGALKKESVNMIFSEFKDQIRGQSRGRGYAMIGGITLNEIVVPVIPPSDVDMSIISNF